MKIKMIKVLLGAASAVALQMPASATDLDLYVKNVAGTLPSDKPNVLFVIDNTANWSSPFTVEKAALIEIFRTLPENKFNVGILMASESGNGNTGNEGGYIRAAMRPMDAVNRPLYKTLVESLSENGDKANGGASSLMMAEAWYYFTGGQTFGSKGKVKTDYFGSAHPVHQRPGNALSSINASVYNPAVSPTGCGPNYIIFISNGPSQANANQNPDAKSKLIAAAGGGTAGNNAAATITLSPSGSQEDITDEWARFMKKSSLNVTTYTIEVDPKTQNQGAGWTALLKSMSGVNNYQAVDSNHGASKIVEAVNDALSKIQSVNSVFAAVSLPASANVQGAYLNQLYIGMFRPDEDSYARWLGNLKQYQIGADRNLADAFGKPAINTATGFIAECASSFWTPTGTDTYWASDAKGACIAPGSDPDLYKVSNSPDGNIVEKGAQAYKTRNGTVAARRIFTCSTTFATCAIAGSRADFTSTIATTAALGAATNAERDAIISWAKGTNNLLELGKGASVVRPSVHGDVIHSNPIALSYGANVVVYYGSNDGMLHAVNGNRTADIVTVGNGTYQAGAELWAFMPPEFLPNIKVLRDNVKKIKMTPQVGATGTGDIDKPYGIDGPLSAFRGTIGGSTKTWLFATMRRGGRAVYAFDVTDPADPQIKWKVGCPNLANDTGCLDDFTSIGQTWSTPRPIRSAGYGGGASPMLIMGGGYDNCEDTEGATCAAGKGKNIFVLDAATGAKLKLLPTDRGVVGEVRFIPAANGLATYAYAADLGGNLYRITIGSAAPADWTIKKIAALGCATADPCTNPRKFMFSPSLVKEPDDATSIYIGSGDREKPLPAAYFPITVGVQNYFFKVRDEPLTTTWLTEEKTPLRCPDHELMCFNSLTPAGTAAGTCGANMPLGSKGYALELRPTEQVVTSAATRFGTSTFSTHMPTVPVPGTCGSNLGTVHVYNLKAESAMPSRGTTCDDKVTGGGLPPSPVKVDVCIDAACIQKEPICIGCNQDSPVQPDPDPVDPGILGANAKRRLYWYIKK